MLLVSQPTLDHALNPKPRLPKLDKNIASAPETPPHRLLMKSARGLGDLLASALCDVLGVKKTEVPLGTHEIYGYYAGCIEVPGTKFVQLLRSYDRSFLTTWGTFVETID